MTNLQFLDPVTLTTNDNETLEGVIAHLGPVQFAPGPDWLGIKLTGSSVGKGKNDGTVKGVFYFDAGGEGNGVFVREGSVEKRNLSRLEGLRLKREVGEVRSACSSSSVGGSSAGAAASAKSPRAAASTTPVRTARSSKLSAPSSAKAAATAATSAEEGESHSDRMEKLRARREALAKDRGKPSARTDEGDGTSQADAKSADAPEQQEQTSVNLATATPGYRAELSRLQSTIASLKNDLKKKEAENASLQASLDFMSKGAEQSTHDAVRMYALGALALSERTPRSGVKGEKEKAAGDKKAAGDTPRSLRDEIDEEGSEEENEEEGDHDNEQVVNQAAAAVSQALVERNDELMSQLSAMASAKSSLEHRLEESSEKISNMQHRLEGLLERYEAEKSARSRDAQDFHAEKTALESRLNGMEREYKILQDRLSSVSSSDSASALSFAKLRADNSSLQRKNEELSEEKMELETTLEELVLDKEALKEENEMLMDQVEEMKIDLEGNLLELEDLRGQLAAASGGGGNDTEGGEPDDARSLALQNSRLRTAILRLREQTEVEKNELQKKLKVLQSDSSSKEELQSELAALKTAHATALNEVAELKDAVDQTASLEETIETLSDKVWNLERNNAELERTIRELEESAEIAAEMEEVQTEELGAMRREMEGREALIRNLEEAIRMQRRREEDFQRYVSDFRNSISALKQEKATLLALTEGTQGEKSHLVATSQKALAQAAQLAADAAEARKRDSDAAFDRIEGRSASYLCRRLEGLLPSGVVSAELAAVKGEMDLSKVADKAAVSLSALEGVFNKAIEKGVSGLSEFNVLEENATAVLSDGSTQQIATMIHQSAFASIAIEAASDALRFMAAGQWPELLSQELSADLGSVVVHSISHLDLALSEQLKLLKQEGVLSPLRSSLSDLDQSVRNTRLALFGVADQSGKPVIAADWNPPGLVALKSLALGRFSCLGAAAVMASAICPTEDSENDPPAPTLANLAGVFEQAKKSCSNVADVCRKFSGLRLNDTETVESLNELASEYRASSSALFDCVKEAFTQQTVSSEDVEKCSTKLEEVANFVRQLSALLRKANLGEIDSSSYHELSPEYGDSWGGVTSVVSQVRSVDGDPEDVNYLMRARAIEQQLAEAVENEPKLAVANAKITSLEKSLSSRSKEIAMQNSRISELESLITKSSANLMTPAKGSKPPGSPSQGTHKLKEENRVLQEALDVMQQQVEEIERENRALKDKSRTPRVTRQASGRLSPKKMASVADLGATMSQFGQASGAKAGGQTSRDLLLESISLETALFRPALASATQSASYWKAQSMGVLSKLAPLNVKVKSQDETRQRMAEVALAKSEMRLAKASFSIVDLTKADVSARNQLNKQKQKELLAKRRLQHATLSLLSQQSLDDKRCLPSFVEKSAHDKEMWGKIIVPCRDDTGFVAPMDVSRDELRDFHSFLVQ